MRRTIIPGFLATLLLCVLPARLGATTVTFGLLGDPGHSYSFARTDSPSGQIVTEPVAPYPGWIGSNAPGNQYGFFCIDYLKAANWNTSYVGTLYHVQDDIPGKTREQVVEAAYLSDRLYHLGGMGADMNLYQGPISFAIWQIMDPAPGHVQRNAAAQPYIQEAQYMYHTGRISASHYKNTLIFVPNNGSIQDFMSLAAASVPEPGTIVLFLAGFGLIGVGLVRRRRHEANPTE
jgi:hypothetical protein